LFVARFDEYRVLYEIWEQAKSGRASHALVLGDSGVGKTTLVNRLLTAAGLEGAAVSRTQCYDIEREIPYATLGNLTLGLLDLPGVSATPPEVLAELARYFGGVRRRFPTIHVVEDSWGETARLRLTEAFQQTLETISEDHPVILVIDDLHLCDEASLAVLHLLMHRVSERPIMLVFVARPGELPNSALATRLRTDAQSLGLREVQTTPLSEAESNEVLAGLLDSSLVGEDPALRRTMVRVAGGFPMVLEFLVQDWAANGRHSLALALDSMTTDFGVGLEVPEFYRKVLDRMVVSLDHGTRNVLNVAAVLGHRLNDLAMYEIADLSTGQVMAAMADLVRHRVLRDSGRGLEFINEFVRTAAYLEVPSPVRRALHLGVAARLMAEDLRGGQFLGLEIAWHAIRADQVADLAPYLMKGAQQALANGALDAAARALSTALPLLAPKDRKAAGLLLAEILQEQGRWAESGSILTAECDEDISELGTILSIVAAQRTGTSSAERLLCDLGFLKSIIDSERDLRIRLLAVNAAAQLMGDVRDCKMAHSLWQSATQIIGYRLSEDDQTHLDLCIAQLLYYSGHQEAASEALTGLAVLFESKGIVNSRLARVFGGLGVVRCYQGHYDKAKAEFEAAYSVAARIGNEAQQAAFAANLELCCLRLGQYKEQLDWSKLARARHPFSSYQFIQAAYYQSFALAMLGEHAEALQTFDLCHSQVHEASPAWLVQAWRLHRADILYLCGCHADACAQARQALGKAHSLHSTSFAGAFARWLALVSVQDRTASESCIVLDELLSRQEEFDSLDRVEVVCGRLILEKRSRPDLEDLLQKYLVGLPYAVTSQLQRLGVLRA
jgi:tetratricopeptide (TPR) repeat protein